MNNFEFDYKGKKYWYSRSVAVVGMIMAHDDNWHWHILANKRGINTPDFQGYWSLPCGYLDFNETCEKAICRETFEETGLIIKEDDVSLIGIDSVPFGRQNVTIRFICSLSENIKDLTLTIENAENGEVEEVKWIPLDDFKAYKWAFNHVALISRYCRPPEDFSKEEIILIQEREGNCLYTNKLGYKQLIKVDNIINISKDYNILMHPSYDKSIKNYKLVLISYKTSEQYTFESIYLEIRKKGEI